MTNRLIVVVLSVLVGNSVYAAGGAPKVTPELLAKGKSIYTNTCLPCHGANGDGNGPAGQLLKPKPRNFNTDKFKNGEKPAQVFKSVSEGLPGTPMVAFKSQIPDADRWAVVMYVLETFKKAKK